MGSGMERHGQIRGVKGKELRRRTGTRGQATKASTEAAAEQWDKGRAEEEVLVFPEVSEPERRGDCVDAVAEARRCVRLAT